MSDLTAFLLARYDEDQAWWDSATFTGVNGYGLRFRMRADVRAKRAIVAEHRAERPERVYCTECDAIRSWPCPTLRHLATVYSDHPDYDETWRP